MKRVIVALAASVCLAAAVGAEEAPKWPAIGSRFPAKGEDARPPMDAERLGLAQWENPPAVISPYDRNWYDYQTIIWGGQVGALKGKAEYYDALRGAYFTGSMVYSDDSPHPSTEGRMGYYNTCITNKLYIRNKEGAKARGPWKKDPGNHANNIRNPSLEDPAVDAAERKLAFATGQRNAPHKPFAYDLRDEATYVISSASPHDFDFSPVSLAAFRVWLKAKYGTLETLNESWAAAFKDWNAITPLTSQEIMQREGLFDTKKQDFPKLNLAAWADHREYNEDTFASAIARYRDEILKSDAGAPIGISGTQMPSAWGGFNFYKLGNATSWIEHYDVNGSLEQLRSFMLTRKVPSIHAAHYQEARGGLAGGIKDFYHVTFHGDAGALVWPFKGNDNNANLAFEVVDGKIVRTKEGDNIAALFREGRNGIPCLLRRAQWQNEPVAVWTSAASIRADWPMDVRRDKSSWVNRASSWEGGHNFAAAGRQGFYKLIEDIGLQFRCYDSSEIVNGKLAADGIKLLIAPRIIAVSKEEAAAVKTFVENGGVLLADLLAARMNDVCRVWPDGKGPLDEVLGLERAPFAFTDESGKEEEEKGGYVGGFGHPMTLKIEADFNGLKAGESFKHQGHYEPGLKAGAGAKALAGTEHGPALVEHAVGKGFAYTLNFDIPNYLTQRAKPDVEALTAMHRRVLSAIAQKAGVAPVFGVARKGKAGHPAGLESFHWSLGDAALYAVHINGAVNIDWENLEDKGAGVADVGHGELEIKLPKKGFVAELRSGKRFGETDALAVEMKKDQPVILGVLPYDVKAVKVDAGAGKIADGKLPISVSIDAPGAKAKLGDHVVHAELVGADGVPVPQSVVNLPLKGGHYKGAIDLSFVIGDGPWTLKVRDVASTVEAEAKVSR